MRFIVPLIFLFACNQPDTVEAFLENAGHHDLKVEKLADGRYAFESTRDHLVCEGTASFEVMDTGFSAAQTASCHGVSACTTDDPAACWELARALKRANESIVRFKAYTVGCEGGSGRHCAVASGMAWDNKALGSSVAWAEKGCALDEAWSCHALGHQGPEEVRHAAHEKACELGSAEACVDLATEEAKQGQSAIDHAFRACELGNGRGCEVLATAIPREKLAFSKPEVLVKHYLGRSCALGHQPACDGFLRDGTKN